MPDTPAEMHTSRAVRLVAAAAVVALLLVVTGCAMVARTSYSKSLTPSLTLADRADAASLAHRLAPWSERYKLRAAVLEGWLRGKQALDAGDYLTAVDTLAVAYRLDVGNRELLADFQQAQKSLSLATTGIAHVQHGLDPSLTPSPASR